MSATQIKMERETMFKWKKKALELEQQLATERAAHAETKGHYHRALEAILQEQAAHMETKQILEACDGEYKKVRQCYFDEYERNERFRKALEKIQREAFENHVRTLVTDALQDNSSELTKTLNQVSDQWAE